MKVESDQIIGEYSSDQWGSYTGKLGLVYILKGVLTTEETQFIFSATDWGYR